MMKDELMTPGLTFGSFGVPGKGPCEYLTLAFSPLSAPLRSRWRNNGLSADFLSDYVVTFLPGTGESSAPGAIQNEVKHAVSYIANELLENAMKYHANLIDTPITIHLELSSEHIKISVSNGVMGDQGRLYKIFVDKLLAEDPVELMMRQMEAAGDKTAETSGLGLLTMINDYGAALGWRFDPDSDLSENLRVTTSATLPLREIHGVVA